MKVDLTINAVDAVILIFVIALCIAAIRMIIGFFKKDPQDDDDEIRTAGS